MKNLGKLPSHRQQRVGEELRKFISTLLIQDELNLSSLKNSFVSIVEVDMSPDLKNAKIYIAVNGHDSSEIIKDLNNKTGYIKKRLSKIIKLKFFPNLKFYIDTSVEYSKNINSILNNLS